MGSPSSSISLPSNRMPKQRFSPTIIALFVFSINSNKSISSLTLPTSMTRCLSLLKEVFLFLRAVAHFLSSLLYSSRGMTVLAIAAANTSVPETTTSFLNRRLSISLSSFRPLLKTLMAAVSFSLVIFTLKCFSRLFISSFISSMNQSMP